MRLPRAATTMQQGMKRSAAGLPLLSALLMAALGAGCQPDTAPIAPEGIDPGVEAPVQAQADVVADVSAQPSPARPNGRFAEELRNATYALDTVSTGKAPLKDGVYTETVAGSSSMSVVRLGPAPAFGDLDADGVEDAAVTLLATPGGSGAFTYVVAVINDDGAAIPTRPMLIGDRVALQSMRIVDGKIHVAWLDRKLGEPMAMAPAVPVSKTLAVQGGNLVAVANAVAGEAPRTEQLRGHYTWGAEVEAFQPCGTTRSFWIVGDNDLLQPLRDKSAALALARGKPYQPVYIEASGVSQGEASDGFAADYEGVYRLQSVRTAGEASPAACAARR